MLLPAIQHGSWKDVRPKIKAVVKRILKGDDVVASVAEGGMLDTATTSSMIVLAGTPQSGPTRFYSLEPLKHLRDELAKRDSDEVDALEDEVFRASLSVSWGVLALMAPSCTTWLFGREDREQPFLDAALRVWDEIDAIGERFVVGFYPQRMWAIPSTLRHVLARKGVPIEKLNAPLPPGGPAALLKYARLAS